MGSLIGIEGLIGSGKSTFLRYCNKKDVEVYFEKTKDHSALEMFYSDMGKYGFLLQQSFLGYRLADSIQGALKAQVSDKDKIIALDRTYHCDEVFAEWQLNKVELEVYKRIRDIMSKNVIKLDAIFYLDTPPKICLERIGKRGREFEKEITLEYLIELERRYDKFLSRIDTPVYRIDNRLSNDLKLDFIKKVLIEKEGISYGRR